MAMDPATAAKQQAVDAQRAADQIRARITELEQVIRQQQDALASEKAMYDEQVRIAQQAQANATRVQATENYILSSAARSGSPPNPVI